MNMMNRWIQRRTGWYAVGYRWEGMRIAAFVHSSEGTVYS